MEAAPNLLQQLCKDGVLNSGGSIAPLASGIAHSCLELGLLQQHLHKVIRPSLAEGCAAVCDALRKEMPGCSFQQPAGGYFVLVELPQEVRAVRKKV
jgi:DNA-binding transcriptional MocR family regulator